MESFITREQLEADNETFDWAIPQEVFNQIIETTGENPSGKIVWHYPKRGGIFGKPLAINEAGAAILKKWKEKTNV